MKRTRKLLLNLVFVLIAIYAVFRILNQQQALDQYHKQQEQLASQINEQNEYKEELNKKKDNIESLDYIEQAAREYLDMYLPNEKVYIDSGK